MLTRRYREGRLIRSRKLRAATLQSARDLALSGIEPTMHDVRWAVCLAFLKQGLTDMSEPDLNPILAALERIGALLDRINAADSAAA